MEISRKHASKEESHIQRLTAIAIKLQIQKLEIKMRQHDELLKVSETALCLSLYDG